MQRQASVVLLYIYSMSERDSWKLLTTLHILSHSDQLLIYYIWWTIYYY